MSDNLCAICERPTADGYACTACAARIAQKLAGIAELAPDARARAYGLTRGSQGGASGKPGSRSPGNDDALDALTEVGNCLSGWARVVAEERGLGIPVAYAPDDQIVRAAQWLGQQVEWLRHQRFADEAFRDIEACARRIRGVVEGPAPKRYLGPCGALLIAPAPPQDGCDCGHEGLDSWYHLKPCPVAFLEQRSTCEGDVYGVAGASKGRCRTCRAEVDQDERRAWLNGEVAERMADTPMRAADIAHAIRVSADTIRTWSHTVYDSKGEVKRAAKLSSYWWDGERYVPWVEPREGEDTKARGPRLHYVADVMDLQRQAADRRAQLDARREQRDTQTASA